MAPVGTSTEKAKRFAFSGLWSQQELNPDLFLRTELLYPLSYGGFDTNECDVLYGT
jgi:hypothetical protein